MDILWPRWVARIGVTRATEACFLTADRQCTELPLLRLPRPRLVPEVVGCEPFAAQDLARVGSVGGDEGRPASEECWLFFLADRVVRGPRGRHPKVSWAVVGRRRRAR